MLWCKDDSWLYVDVFLLWLNYGECILCVFMNVNLVGVLCVWCVGELFEDVVKCFLLKIWL